MTGTIMVSASPQGRRRGSPTARSAHAGAATRQPTVLIDCACALERIAMEAIFAAQRRFFMVFGTVETAGSRGSASWLPDVLVWVGDPHVAKPPAGPGGQPKTLIVLRDITAASAVLSLRQGAHGLACMRCHLDQLPQAVDAIMTGQGWLAPCLAKVVADHLAGRARLPESESRGLTARELLVLRFIASGANTEEVAARLGIDIRTVKFHASNI